MATQRSEASRLRTHVPKMDVGPKTYFLQLRDSGIRPYTIKTIFTRLSDFRRWQIDSGTIKTRQNDYREFIVQNANLFKNAYEKEQLTITYSEALKKVRAIKDEAVREKAMQLLATGMRWTESFTLDSRGTVLGKGNKRRKIFNASMEINWKKSYTHFRETLKRETGLKPHSLRKLFATRLAQEGLREADLMSVMGWSNIQTAASYLQPIREKELQETISQIVNK